MKIKPEHYEYMKGAIFSVLASKPDAQQLYKDKGLSDKRFRWDASYAAKLSPWIGANVYTYANDEHIDTALKHIIAEWNSMHKTMRDNPLQLKPAGSNQTIVTLDDGSEVFFSYKTPVAAHIPGTGFFRTDQSWSRTTSKHINQYLQGAKAAVKPQAWFDSLVSGFRNNPRHKEHFTSAFGYANINVERRRLDEQRARRRRQKRRIASPESSGIHIDIGSHNARRNPKSNIHNRYTKNQIRDIRRIILGMSLTQLNALMRGFMGYTYSDADESEQSLREWLMSDFGSGMIDAKDIKQYAGMTRNPRRKHAMPKRRRTVTIRRPAHAKRYGAGHPYFSKLPIHVQESTGAAWRTVAAFVGTPEGIRRAKQYAGIWKRERGARVKVRVIDIR